MGSKLHRLQVVNAVEASELDLPERVEVALKGIAGAAKGSADLMLTLPRLCGRNWQTEAVKPENRCSPSPILPVLKVRKSDSTSGVLRSGLVRKNPPA